MKILAYKNFPDKVRFFIEKRFSEDLQKNSALKEALQDLYISFEDLPENYPSFVCAEFIPPNKIAYYKEDLRWDGIVHDTTHFFQYCKNKKAFLESRALSKVAITSNFNVYREDKLEQEAFKVQQEYIGFYNRVFKWDNKKQASLDTAKLSWQDYLPKTDNLVGYICTVRGKGNTSVESSYIAYITNKITFLPENDLESPLGYYYEGYCRGYGEGASLTKDEALEFIINKIKDPSFARDWPLVDIYPAKDEIIPLQKINLNKPTEGCIKLPITAHTKVAWKTPLSLEGWVVKAVSREDETVYTGLVLHEQLPQRGYQNYVSLYAGWVKGDSIESAIEEAQSLYNNPPVSRNIYTSPFFRNFREITATEYTFIPVKYFGLENLIKKLSSTSSQDFDFYKDRNKEMYQRRLHYYNEDDGANIFWSSRTAQEKRFEALLDIGDLTDKTILDVGCGYCDLFNFIKAKNYAIKSYTGIDIVPDIVSKAKQLHPNTSISIRDIQKEPLEKDSFDYIFGSGIFALEDPNWSKYTVNMLKIMLEGARIGVAVNFLKGSSALKDGLMRLDPVATLEFIKKHVHDKAVLKNNYLHDDFSIFIYK